jgi:hypothetical protein
MDGWTNGRLDGWTNGRMDGWTNGRMERSLRPAGHCGLDPQSFPSPEHSSALPAVRRSFQVTVLQKNAIVQFATQLEFWNYELRINYESITNYELRITADCGCTSEVGRNS